MLSEQETTAAFVFCKMQIYDAALPLLTQITGWSEVVFSKIQTRGASLPRLTRDWSLDQGLLAHKLLSTTPWTTPLVSRDYWRIALLRHCTELDPALFMQLEQAIDGSIGDPETLGLLKKEIVAYGNTLHTLDTAVGRLLPQYSGRSSFVIGWLDGEKSPHGQSGI